MAELFHTAVYQPIYNALVFLVGAIPGGDIGIAIIILTVVVRTILFPLSLTAIKTQMTMRRIEPKLKALREELKENKEELARRTMALFKDHKINPFAGFFLILIQLPVIIGLYLVFQNESTALSFDPALLYSFVSLPDSVSFLFLGFVDLAGRSIPLAIIVAATQFLFARLMMPPAPPEKKAGEEASFQEDFQRSMSIQMRYVFPIILGVIAYIASASIALYFVVSNIFSIGQELLVRRMNNNEHGN
jgi:YidC/Oxa1 family membrane protein insertase